MPALLLSLVSCILLLSPVSPSALPSPLNLVSNPPDKTADSGSRTTNGTNWPDLAGPELSSEPECSVLLGRDLNYDSCDNARDKISQATAPMTFGERGTGSWDVVLPRRYISGTFFWTLLR